MSSKALTLIAFLLIAFVNCDDNHGWDHTNSLNTYKYDPSLLEDYKRVDLEILQQWQEMVTTVYSGYGYLKQESEEELKKSVQWVADFYYNVTKQYEEALYNFEQTYISTSDQPNYEFLYNIEEIVYDNLDQLDVATREDGEKLENDYWSIIEKLDQQQNEVEKILEATEDKTNAVMDVTETDIQNYISSMNEKKWELLEIENEVEEDIDDDLVDYYEDDEDDFTLSETSSASALINGIATDVEDFDTAPSYLRDYESADQDTETHFLD